MALNIQAIKQRAQEAYAYIEEKTKKHLGKFCEIVESTNGFVSICVVGSNTLDLVRTFQDRVTKHVAVTALEKTTDSIYASKVITSLRYVFSGKMMQHIQKGKHFVAVTSFLSLVARVIGTFGWFVDHRLLAASKIFKKIGSVSFLKKITSVVSKVPFGDVFGAAADVGFLTHRIRSIMNGKTHSYYILNAISLGGYALAGLGGVMTALFPPVVASVVLSSSLIVAAGTDIASMFFHDDAKALKAR